MAATTNGPGVRVHERPATPPPEVNGGHVDVHRSQTNVITPKDRVRWGPIFAGLVAAMSTLILLSLLGLAIGLTAWDGTGALANFGLAAGIWGAVSALLAFMLGGWVAARSSAVGGQGTGAFNGAMVWALTLTFMLFLIGGGVGPLLGMAGTEVTGAAVVVPVEQAAQAAWGTLLPLLLGLGAAALGGFLGARPRAEERAAVGRRMS
jgi:hypothetical protein